MANEKGQGAKGADIQNTNAAYTLMASGAFEDGGLLLESYLASHEVNGDTAPVVLAYVLHTVEVAKCLRGESFEGGKIDIDFALGKGELFVAALAALDEEQGVALWQSYMPKALDALMADESVEGGKLLQLLSLLGEDAKKLCVDYTAHGGTLSGKLGALLDDEDALALVNGVLDALYSVDKALYGKEALSLGKAAVEAGTFESAQGLLENASYHLADLAECRFLQLCAALGVRDEEEFLHAESFSKTMPEYLNLLVAIAESEELMKKYTELAEKNLSGEFYGTEYVCRREGQYVYLGEYPQSLKANNVKITAKTDSRGYYLGSDGAYYAKLTATPDHDDYRFTNGQTVRKKRTYYFKVEPLRWRILKETEDGRAFLMCDNVIFNSAVKKYNRTVQNTNDYKNSDVRAFLNGEFLEKAFGKEERDAILQTLVDNSSASAGYKRHTNVCPDTNDKIFLPSVVEMTTAAYGFDADKSVYDAARMRMSTDYSRASGLMISYYEDSYGYSNYWLRSPQNNSNYQTLYVCAGGNLGNNFSSTCEYGGVCPAMWVSLTATKPIKITTARKKGTEEQEPKAQKTGFDWKRWKLPLMIGGGVVALVALILAAIFLMPNACYKMTAKYIEFGEYPQSLKEAWVTVDESVQDERGYYLGSDGAYYAKVEAYFSVTNGGNSYYDNYTFNNGEQILQGVTYYFKVEPIRWRVLDDGSDITVISEYILFSSAFDDNSSDYDTSTLYWNLNTTFSSLAFDSQEQSLLIPTNVIASTEGSTRFFVELPTTAQITNSDYGFAKDASSTRHIARHKNTTDYARATGVYFWTDEEGGDYFGNAYWWCADETGTNEVHVVAPNGFAAYPQRVTQSYFGVAPVIIIKDYKN